MATHTRLHVCAQFVVNVVGHAREIGRLWSGECARRGDEVPVVRRHHRLYGAGNARVVALRVRFSIVFIFSFFCVCLINSNLNDLKFLKNKFGKFE